MASGIAWVGVLTGLAGVTAQEPSPAPPLALLIQGKVQDKQTGKPIAGATVVIRHRLTGVDPRQRQAGRDQVVRSDELGRVKLVFPSEQVADPRVHVSVEVHHPGCVAWKSPYLCLAELDVQRRFGDRPSLGTIPLGPGLDYSGRITTPEGKPAADVPFILSVLTGVHRADLMIVYPAEYEGRSDAQGRFHAFLPSTDTLNLKIIPDQLAPVHQSWGIDPRDPDYKQGLPREFGDFQLDRGVRVTGRVLDLKGRPLAGLELVAAGPPGLLARSAVTGPDGRFAFAPLAPGDYKVHARGQDLNELLLENFALPDSATIIGPAVVRLGPGIEPPPLTLREVPTVLVEVREQDARGRPLANQPVMIAGELPAGAGVLLDGPSGPTSSSPSLRTSSATSASTTSRPRPIEAATWGAMRTTGADGVARFRVPRGLADAVVAVSNPTSAYSFRTRLAPTAPLMPGERAELGVVGEDLRGITQVRYAAPILLITLNADANPLPDDASVDIEPVPDGAEESVPEHMMKLHDGRYRVAKLLPDEDYTLRATATGHGITEARVRLPEGTVRELKLAIRKPAGPG